MHHWKSIVYQSTALIAPHSRLSRWAHSRPLFRRFLRVAMIASSVLVTWNLSKCVTGSVAPLVVVLSESMSPAMHRGDILLLQNTFQSNDVNVGDIVVFHIKEREIPIVHRVINKVIGPTHYNTTKDDWLFLSKGDNNRLDDVGIYAEGQNWITRKDIQGKVVGILRYVGFVTIMLNDYPVIKYALLAIMGWTTFTSGGDD